MPWYGIYVPAATPAPLLARINAAINKALQNPDVQRQLSLANIPGKADVARRTRRADEGRSAKRTTVDQDLWNGAAVDSNSAVEQPVQ